MRPSTSPDQTVAPTLEDPVAAAASQVAGGPLGRYAAIGRRSRDGWQAAAAVLSGLVAVMVALAVAQRSHCVRTGWSTPDQFWHACYSDLPLVFQTSGLATGTLPYLHNGAGALDQPVGSGLAMWVMALLVPGGPVTTRQQWYFGLWAVLVTVLLVLLVIVTAASVRRHPWKAAHVALSPVIVTASLVSVDLLGVVLTSVGLWAWGRRRVPLAGLVLGLAIATRTYPLVIVAAIGLVAVRGGRLRQWAALAGVTLATWLLVSLPWLVVNADGFLSTYRRWWGAGAGYGSLWLVPQLFDHDLPVGAVTVLAVMGWVAALVAGATLALATQRRPAVAEVALLMLAIVLVTGKSVPVQACLWLLPLIALVGVRWRDHLIWAGTEVVYSVAVWLYLAGLSVKDRGLPSGPYAGLLLARLLALGWLVTQVVRVARARWALPEDELGETEVAEQERLEGEVDELAGPIAGAEDRVLVRFG
ncbi:glycosyltransferase family 87 protein [Oryzihumus leptocrescens]|uniref:Putative membrane protein n=1 Tax=Oryzihumus leptocrescens TaxID=297536 RepID=A0A542Z7S3_9MICO|nr:glycosyltransferase 87 family protein [Oryzihumus leptocrescens]TQL56354.1 putative membrane protein [Oryzihumus leptocrescens]